MESNNKHGTNLMVSHKARWNEGCHRTPIKMQGAMPPASWRMSHTETSRASVDHRYLQTKMWVALIQGLKSQLEFYGYCCLQ